jgi:hypothetical protein
MFHRFAVRLTLACYGLIAVFGQGLHFWLEHDDDIGPAHGTVALVAAAEIGSTADGVLSAGAGGQHHGHDEHDCSICQHHSLGQLFVAAPPAETALAACGFLSSSARESAHCPALFSPAQPRAPPIG